MLTCDTIGLQKQGRQLFSGLSISLMPCSLLIIRGANGSGKTSLLRILAGLEKPSEGRALWEEVPINEHTEYHQTCQYVGHRNAMKADLTAEENLLFWARLAGDEMLLPVASHLWQLDTVLDQRYGSLSAGWQRRVALARLLTCHGKLWLMDEPMANLDKEGIALLERLVISRCAQGGMVIMTSHIELDIKEADQLFIEDFQV